MENREFLITKKLYTSPAKFYRIFKGKANGKEYRLWLVMDYGDIRPGAFVNESFFSKVEEVRA